MNETKRIFLSFLTPDYSRSGVIFDSNDDRNIFLNISSNPRAIISELLRIKKTNNSSEVVTVVMSPSHMLVLYLKIFTRFRVILDAGWPLSDSHVQKTNYLNRLIVKGNNFLIDFISFKLCDLLILESQEQLCRVSRKYFLPKKKISVRLTGLNELAYTEVAPMRPAELSGDLSNRKIILYRGKNNPESGISLLVSLQELIHPDWVLIIVTNKAIGPLDPKKSVLINRHVSEAEIRWLYENARLTLGQLSYKKRLKFTIPHKAFESAFFGVPYISPRHDVLNELFGAVENYLALDDLDNHSILDKIEQIIEDDMRLNEIGNNSKISYFARSSQRRLTEIFNLSLSANG
ncbi:GT4_PimA-like domain containing protein [Candidatus Nanopelagicaceae bacterium]